MKATQPQFLQHFILKFTQNGYKIVIWGVLQSFLMGLGSNAEFLLPRRSSAAPTPTPGSVRESILLLYLTHRHQLPPGKRQESSSFISSDSSNHFN